MNSFWHKPLITVFPIRIHTLYSTTVRVCNSQNCNSGRCGTILNACTIDKEMSTTEKSAVWGAQYHNKKRL
jgi:hypothetical protein